MASLAASPPELFSIPRLTTLLASVLVALSAGTNYVYSAYAPQLGARLHITHTQLNIIGLAGNVGVYSTGPIWGRIVDARGPRVLLASAFLLLLGGYLGIRQTFEYGEPTSDSVISTLCMFSLVACAFMTGAGGNAGLNSAVNSTARSFPDRARATATGFVISGFGLSALFFSTAAHVIFPDNTSSFLLLLATGTSLPMILGFFFVRPIPLPASEGAQVLEHGVVDEVFIQSEAAGTEPFTVYQRENDSHTHLLASDDMDMDDVPGPASYHPHEEVLYAGHYTSNSVEMNPTRGLSPNGESRHRSRSAGGRSGGLARAAQILQDEPPNIHGKQMFFSKDFLILFTIMSLLTGTGLMWINNAGSISQALFAKGNSSYDELKAAKWQAAQVSTVSFANFMGRVLIGLTSDFAKNRMGYPRSYCVSLVAFLFVISQLLAVSIVDVKDLWKASAMLGLAYGSLFGLFPTVSIDWFGLAHFSENWGYLSLSPLFGGNIFSIAFGRNLDAHAPEEKISSTNAMRRAGLPSSHQCLDGRECYVDSLYITIAACFMALGLSIWAGWRDHQKAKKFASIPEVVWEEDEI